MSTIPFVPKFTGLKQPINLVFVKESFFEKALEHVYNLDVNDRTLEN